LQPANDVQAGGSSDRDPAIHPEDVNLAHPTTTYDEVDELAHTTSPHMKSPHHPTTTYDNDNEVDELAHTKSPNLPTTSSDAVSQAQSSYSVEQTVNRSTHNSQHLTASKYTHMALPPIPTVNNNDKGVVNITVNYNVGK